MKICDKCKNEFPSWTIYNGKKLVLTSRKYCLSCSPVGLHRIGGKQSTKPRICKLCNKDLRWNKIRRSLCGSCNTKIRRYRCKEALVKLLGGKCKKCGWSGNIAGFDFHHLGDKEFIIGSASNKSWEVVKKEALKCELLCACCHRIHHSNNENSVFLNIVKNYKGKVLLAS